MRAIARKTKEILCHTCADKLSFLNIRDIETSHMGGGHALCERCQPPPLPQPIGKPGQVAVAVQAVGVQATREGENNEGKTVRQHQIKVRGGLYM